LERSVHILFLATTEDPADWVGPLREMLPEDEIVVYPEAGGPGAIECALVAVPPPGVLATLPHLRLIQSLWVGVESLLGDATLPAGVPLARLVDPQMAETMAETVIQHVLNAHRDYDTYRDQQAARLWRQLPQVRAQDRRVGMLGLGELGLAGAQAVKGLGFDVAGWSRRPKEIAGIATFAGIAGLGPFLARTEILVCLLPLTAETRGILNARTLAQLPRGATVINIARGGHVVDDDLLAALESGQVGRAVLDVFHTEPLPTDHPFWGHPRVTLLPHVAAATDPRSAVRQVAENVRRLKAGLPLLNVVDRAVGY
jgi:glyoxylate/hydroxypyruvate reductase A